MQASVAAIAEAVGAARLHRAIALADGAGQQMAAIAGKGATSWRGRKVVVICSKQDEASGAAQYAAYHARKLGALPLLFPLPSASATVDSAKSAVAAGSSVGADAIIGFGGRGVHEAARAAAMLMTNEGKVPEYASGMGDRSPEHAPLPCVLVPSIGTGRECARSATLISEGATSLPVRFHADAEGPGLGVSGGTAGIVLDPTVLRRASVWESAEAASAALVCALEFLLRPEVSPEAAGAAMVAVRVASRSLQLLSSEAVVAAASGRPHADRDAAMCMSAAASVAASAAAAAASPLSEASGIASALACAAEARYDVEARVIIALCGPAALDARAEALDAAADCGEEGAEEAIARGEAAAGAMRECGLEGEALCDLVESANDRSGASRGREGPLEDLTPADLANIAAGAESEPGAGLSLGGATRAELVSVLEAGLDL